MQKYLNVLTPPQKGLALCHALLLLYGGWVLLPGFLPALAQCVWYGYAVAAALILPLAASLLYLVSCVKPAPRFLLMPVFWAALGAGFVLSLAGEFSGGGLILLLYAATLFILKRA